MKKNTIKILASVFGGAVLIVAVIFLFSLSNKTSISGDSQKISYESEDFNAGGLQLEKDNRIVLTAVGDIMLARTVEQKMIDHNDWTYPFAEASDLTADADLAFGNLETPILKGEVSKSGSFFFRTDPKAIQGLKLAGFDVLSLANNHMMNFGEEGLKSTVGILDGAGIAYAGAGIAEEKISKPVIKEVKGIRFGFLAYTYAENKSVNSEGDVFGTAYMDAGKMKLDVEELKKEVDVVVVSMHSGVEYETEPNSFQRNFARSAIDSGASLVVGHHPHVVQSAEKYKDGYIFYSLGNFVFDQMWSEETRLGAVARVTFFGGKISDVEFVPVKIFDYCQPQTIEGQEAEKISERLRLE